MKHIRTTTVQLISVAATAAIVSLGAAVRAADAGTVPVKIVKTANGYQLLRGGKPYFIKGAGGDGSKTDLKAAGANSWRTWGVGPDTAGQLAEAQKLGMTVTAGIWLGHKEHGFSYEDAAAVAAQKEAARQDILKYRNAPALLQWGIGNEMENGYQDDPNLWDAVEDIAKMAHQLDPNHPTMVVVAEIGGDKVAQVNAHCPDIDIVGINSYGGGPSVGQRYVAAGGTKPYEITEFGPAGTWESGKNAWGVVPELTSTEKADRYKETYVKTIEQPMCLGSYAFTWGSKQEATATWYGLRLPDGSKLGAVDSLTRLWSGHPAADLCPVITALSVDDSGQTAAGATVKATLGVSDPEHEPLQTTWILQGDPADYKTGGDGQAAPPSYPDAVVASSTGSATIQMPAKSGLYRLYAYVHDGHGGAAVANVSLDAVKSAASAAKKAALPLTVYSEDGGPQPYVPAGYMGTTAAIKMDPACTVQPHSGKTCLKVDYTYLDNWGGVVWQDPAGDWGDKPGGLDLTGAKQLSFWARGDKGGEVVTFLYGLLGPEKAYPDSGTGKTQVTLTKDWKQYTIPLAGTDLSQIKTGFAWTLAAPGHPVTFYLDDVRYE